MSDSRPDDADMTQRHQLPTEPTRPPVVRASGDADDVGVPPADGSARMDPPR